MILRYTKQVQGIVKSKIEPAPWLHIGFILGKCVIYVWDTRQIIEVLDTDFDPANKGYDRDIAKDNKQPLVGKNADDFNRRLFNTGYKITNVKEFDKTRFGSQNYHVNWYVNDILVNRSRKYSDMYCTVKNGRPGNIRDTRKNAYESSWQRDGIRKLFGDKAYVPKNAYPDLTWGDQGGICNRQSVENMIQANLQ
jgi:hypothetical protein